MLSYGGDVSIVPFGDGDAAGFAVGRDDDEAGGAIVFLGDRRLAVGVGSVFGSARVEIWHEVAHGWEREASLAGHQFLVDALALVGHDRLASAGSATVRVWALDRLGAGSTSELLDGDVEMAAFAGAGHVLVATGHTSRDVVRLWQIDEPYGLAAELALPAVTGAAEDGPDSVVDIASSTDGRMIAIGSRTGRLALYDLAGPPDAARWCEPVGDGTVESIGFSHDGTRVAAVADGTVSVFAVETGERLAQWEPFDGETDAIVAMDEHGERLVAFGLGHAAIWEIDGPRCVVDQAGVWFRYGAAFVIPQDAPDGVGVGDVVYEVPGGGAAAAHGRTLEPVAELGPGHRAAFARHTGIDPRWRWETRNDDAGDRHRSYLTLVEAESGRDVAWYPWPHARVTGHPSRDCWLLQRGAELQVVVLEPD
jgi:hypothetical protein